VLDYVISRLTPWRSNRIEIPPAPEQAPVDELQPLEEPTAAQASGENTIPTPTPAGKPLPWLSLGSLAAALLGQIILEPPATNWPLAVFCYFGSACMLVFGIRRGEWQLPQPPADGGQPFQLKIWQTPLLIGLVFMVAAFFSFQDNRFTELNVFLWIMTIGFSLVGLCPPASLRDFIEWIRSLRASLSKSPIRVHISPGWALLVSAAAMVIFFFRIYRLDQIPIEMFSDQAEKLLDINDVLNGEFSIFFPRNTGREAIQFYLTAAIISLFGTGLTFTSLKIGTVFAGLLTLPYIYLIGRELGNNRVGLLAAFLAGIAYWPNVISRIGLRFPFYPLFVAPTLFYLLRGLRTSSRRDFIFAGLALGIGLHGYTPIRIMPLVVLVAFLLFLLHHRQPDRRMGAALGLGLIIFTSFICFLPLFRYLLENPSMFGYRAFSRLGTVEQPLSSPLPLVFLSNLWNALMMFFINDGEIWVHSVPGRAALDIVSAACFALSSLLIMVRYFRQRLWQDLFLLLSVPMLLLPSVLSLAYPAENPALNRAAGAVVPVFVIVALGLDGLLTGLMRACRSSGGKSMTVIMGLTLLSWSCIQNYDLVFRQFDHNFTAGAWNTSEIGRVVRGFADTIGGGENAHVIPFPHWVDTRLVGINAGFPTRDFAIKDERIVETASIAQPQLFILRPEDTRHAAMLRDLFPDGFFKIFESPRSESKNFLMFYVIPQP
jgi:hypothetical protein